MGVTGPELHVEIDELVLTGFDRMDRDLLVQSFHRELTRLLHQPLPVTSDAEVLTGLPVLPHTTSARRLGAALARSVHSGLMDGDPP